VLEERQLLSTFTVTSTADDGSAGTLRYEIEQANLNVGVADTIDFDPTVFAAPQTISLKSGELELTDAATTTISGPGAALLSISGNSASRVFFNNYGSAALSSFTITGGKAGSGGGLYNNGGTVTLTNCTISGNSAASGGGVFTCGVYSYSGYTYYGATTLTNCTVSGNSANSGGGLFSSAYGATTLTNCNVSGNSASYGGGLFTGGYDATTTLTNCTVSGNTAADNGGGLASRGSSTTSGGTTTLTDVTLIGNSAGNDGGGSYNSDGVLAMARCTVSGNSAGLFGGGLLNAFGKSDTLTDCTLSGNSAGKGGGGLASIFGATTLTNCTVSGNSAGKTGGGLYNLANPYSTLNVGNTIVAVNTAPTGPDSVGTNVSQGNNLIGNTSGSSGWVGSDLTGTLAAPVDPLLAPLGAFGGSTQTMPLLPGSPAIDAGSNVLIPASVTTDQRGLPRIVNSLVDIGAFESSGFTIAVTSGGGQSAGVLTAFPAPLVATVAAKNPIEPVAGGVVRFTPPSVAASATLSRDVAIISSTGTASITATANGVVGSYSVSATASGVETAASFMLKNEPLVIALDPSATGSLRLVGNASINTPGIVYVDSSSASALSASDNANVTAAAIMVHGGVKKSGNASLEPTPVTGAGMLAVVSLPSPNALRIINHGVLSLTGNSSRTIQPGVYKGISVSGNAKLVMASGIYIIEGGGFAASGNASVSGAGVMVFNAGGNYPGIGGTYGRITLAGTGTFSMSAMISGPYAGIVFFQPRDNKQPLTVTANASGIMGMVYAPGAALAETGNGVIEGSLIVDTLSISGNGVVGPGPTTGKNQAAAALNQAGPNTSFGTSPIAPKIKVPSARGNIIRSTGLAVVPVWAVGSTANLFSPSAPDSSLLGNESTFDDADGANRLNLKNRAAWGVR
jgi:hypothetical protein